MKKYTLFLFSIVLSANLLAQDTSINKLIKPESIAIRAGLYDFKKTNNTDGLATSVANFGVQYIKGLTKKVDFVAGVQFTSLKYPYYTSLKVPTQSKPNMYTAVDFNVNYKFLTDENPIVPYVTAGVGVGIDRNFLMYAPVGAGLQIKANKGSFIFIQATHNAEISKLTKKLNDYSVSYSFPFKLKNKKPVMIPPAPLAVDGDNDGVVDSLDKCPNVNGSAKYNGCPIPDTDNDGINDELDKCPNEIGNKKYNGCPIPDTDKDGINDEMDKCPTVNGLNKYGGCPIPDTDKDGVNDEIDNCPTVAGISANGGCEDIQPMIKEIANDFKFTTGQSVLTSKILNKLDAVIVLLNKYPNVKLEIVGNTDNTGSYKINQPLSEKRATIVYNYLLKKKIQSDRISKKGVADKNPIDTNNTKQGRANNRRTDMNVIY